MFNPLCRAVAVASLLPAALSLVRAERAGAQENWPQFRGPGSTGVANEDPRRPSQWSATDHVAWKTDLPGLGWSSPVVWGNRVFLTTVINTGAREPVKKGLYFGGDRPEPPTDVHQWRVYCLDLATGQIIWQHQPHEGPPPGPIHLKNSYASETPICDGEHVWAVFGNVGVFCYDHAGTLKWSKPLPARPMRHGWGTAASPALDGDRLYILSDNDEASFLWALDARTGDEIWKVDRADEKSNWSTPFVWHNAKRTEIITPGTVRHRSYDTEGKLLWELSGASSITIATPYVAEGLLYLSSGYVMDKSRPIFAVRSGGSGDITPPEGKTSSEFIAWSRPDAAPYNPSTLVYGDRLYVLLDRGLLACYDARTGEEVYDRQRIPEGQSFTSSPWAYNGQIFCLNEDGLTFVIPAGDTFSVAHTNPLAEDDLTLATPAIAGHRLLLRTAVRLYCIAP